MFQCIILACNSVHKLPLQCTRFCWYLLKYGTLIILPCFAQEHKFFGQLSCKQNLLNLPPKKRGEKEGRVRRFCSQGIWPVTYEMLIMNIKQLPVEATDIDCNLWINIFKVINKVIILSCVHSKRDRETRSPTTQEREQ